MKKNRKCLWLKAIGEHTLISVYNFWVSPCFHKFSNGNTICGFLCVSIFKQKAQ